jgi:ATP-dependent helicase/nuclease subunit A
LTAIDIAAELRRTARAQAGAADPAASVWVSANAGTGKTHVLTMRVLRLMLAGTLPERILCLTYTKAAAAEMSKRVFATLAQWVTMPDAQLSTEIERLNDRAPTREELVRARTLFARAIETPGGLKVQTIHAFCERLLQRFPLEAGIPAGFVILDDETARTLRRESIDLVLSRASREPASPLGAALRFAVAYAADDRFDEVLAATLSHKAWLAEAIRLDVDGSPAFTAAEALFRRTFGVRDATSQATIDQELAACLSPAEMTRARDILSAGSNRDVAAAAKLTTALQAAWLTAKAEALTAFFLTAEGEPRAALMTKRVAAEHPDLEGILQRAQARCATLATERTSLRAVTATMALHRLAEAVHQAYAEAKGRRAALDFEDLIVHTSNLLAPGTNHAAEWVLFKLDGGLDHLLVDESQDTSPAQWNVIAALAREFFSAEADATATRTLFAVGDEKQSIYSFQGAVPEKFADMGAQFAALAHGAGQPWHAVPLDVSFRTVEPVLIAVDATFADPARTPGVRGAGQAIRHIAKREGQAGLVEIWPTEVDADVPADDVWSPFSEGRGATPAQRLAARIATTIRDWLDSGERLVSENRAIRAGDIIILVRKRLPFAAPMVAELKKRGIPVAGADRLTLTEQIGVQDLLTLGDFLTLPEDDLALATLLKSPMFGLDDDDLLVLAPGRKGTLWKALLDNADVDARYRPAADTLKRWRKTADFMPPFEFFADLLDNQGMRRKLLARLGPDAADSIDEFLNLALTYDDGASPSLAGFVHWLRDDERVVKRDMEQGRNEVRVMTVHGAKGLEAPIVFLPDTCSTASAGRNGGGPIVMPGMPRPQGTAEPFVWQVKGMRKLGPISEAKAALDVKERAERDRLLYVAMTRARDRLYVAGFEGKKGRDAGCWYEHIVAGLSDFVTPVETAQGKVWRLEAVQTSPFDKPKFELSETPPDTALPSWATTSVRREPQLTVPLAPSRLAPYETDGEGEPAPAPPPVDKLAEPPPLTPAALADKSRFLRGTLTHALLEHLPAFGPGLWPKIAKAFIAERGAGLSRRTQASIVAEALAILADPTFGALFGPGSSAEVPIVAEIPRPTGDGPALRLSGQIDRLIDNGREVLIVDYKTNRPPPRSLDQVADAYIYQLAAYRLALTAIFNNKPVRAAILWTDGPRLMEIPRETLDSYAHRLWTLERPSP